MIGLRTMLYLGTAFVATEMAFAESPAEAIPDPAQIQESCVDLLKENLLTADFWPAMHAAEALSSAGHQQFVIDAISPRLDSISDARQKCGLARELVRAGDRSKVEILLNILASPDPYGHVHACESLYKVQETGDGTLLRQAMQDQGAPVKALMAAAALAQAGDEDAFRFIRQEVQKPASGQSWVAAWILGKIGDQQDVTRLRTGLEMQLTEREQSYFQHALALLGDETGQAALRANFTSDDVVIRADAAYMAGDAGMKEAQTDLLKLLKDDHPDVAIRAAQGLLALAQNTSDDLEPEHLKRQLPRTVLTLSPGPGNSRNSEGDFIQTKDGRLLFIYSHFGEGHGGDHDIAFLRERVSLDGGNTWLAEERTILKPASGLNVMSVSLLRLQSGDLALFYLAKVSLGDCRPEMRISKDEGQSWGEPVQCITDDIDYYVLNNNRAIQLKSGRLVLSVCRHRDLGDRGKRDWQGELMCYLSDDNGATWRRSTSSLTAQTDTGSRLTVQEPGVIELNDGTVMMYARSNSGSQMISFSKDHGDTWSPLKTSNIASPLSPASIARIPATGDLLLVWNHDKQNTGDPKPRRSPFTVAVSRDDGITWEHVKDLETDPDGWYCYTAIEFVDDTVLLGHCAGNRRVNGLVTTKLTRFGLDWLYDRVSMQD